MKGISNVLAIAIELMFNMRKNQILQKNLKNLKLFHDEANQTSVNDLENRQYLILRNVEAQLLILEMISKARISRTKHQINLI